MARPSAGPRIGRSTKRSTIRRIGLLGGLVVDGGKGGLDGAGMGAGAEYAR